MQSQDLKSYKWKEHIRARPGMYVRDFHLNGLKQMFQYFFEELLEDCLEKPVFELEFHPNNLIIIKVNNIDTQKVLSRFDRLESSDNKLDSWGLGVFIALSADISIAVYHRPSLVVLMGEKGNFELVATTSYDKENNVIIYQTVDNEIFKDFEIIYEHINDFLREFAILNPPLKIISIDKTNDDFQRNVFYYPTGIFKQLDKFISQQHIGKPSFRLDIDTQLDALTYKIGICYSYISYGKSFIRTYAGNVETFLGGSLNDGILDGLILSIKTLAEKENVDIHINKRLATEHLIIIASVKGENFVYTGSTKGKLGMPQLRKDVRKIVFDHLTDYFLANPMVGKSILNQFQRME